MTLHQKIEQDTATPAQMAAFLGELTSLSAKYGIGIAGSPVLFVMEPEDHAHAYRIDGESNLLLG